MTQDDMGRTDDAGTDSRDGAVFVGRVSLFHREVTCRLGQDGVSVERQGRVTDIAYRDILSIRRYAVTLNARGPARTMRRCKVTGRNASFLIQSGYFQGWGRFDDRTAAYESFIETLSGRVAAAAPDAVFLEGLSVGSWRGWVCAFVLFILLGVVGLAMMPQGLALTAACAASLPAVLAMVRQGPARRMPTQR